MSAKKKTTNAAPVTPEAQRAVLRAIDQLGEEHCGFALTPSGAAGFAICRLASLARIVERLTENEDVKMLASELRAGIEKEENYFLNGGQD